MSPSLRILLWVVLGAAIGLVGGSVIDAITKNQGWWLVLLFAGMLFAAFYAYWKPPTPRPSDARADDSPTS